MAGLDLMAGALLLFLRCYGAVVVFPLFRGYLKQPGIIGLSTVIAIAVAGDGAAFSGQAMLLTKGREMVLLGAGLRELVIGSLLGLPLVLGMEAYVMAGRIADVARGAQFGEQLNPSLGQRLSPFETVCGLGVLVLVFAGGGYQFLVLLVEGSLKTPELSLGLGQVHNTLVTVIENFNLQGLVRLSADAIVAGFGLALPLVLISLLIDVAAAVMTRVLGRVNVTFELLPLKMTIGIIIFSLLCITWIEGSGDILVSALQLAQGG